MNLLHKVEEIPKLQKIIDRRVDQFEREINHLIKGLDRLRTHEEVKAMEDEVIEHCLRDYDGEAVPFMGHPCNPNWRDGGGDNLEVRKRMLLRELEKKRGKLGNAVDKFNASLHQELNAFMEVISHFTHGTEQQLPLSSEELQHRVDALYRDLDQLARSHNYSEGYNAFDFKVKGELVQGITAAVTAVCQTNNELTEKLHRERLQVYLAALTQFQNDIRPTLPLKDEELQGQIDVFLVRLDELVSPHYPAGYNSFDNLVGGELGLEIDNTFAELKQENAEKVAKQQRDRLLGYLESLRNFQLTLSSGLPLPADDLESQIATFQTDLSQLVSAQYPEGLEFFDGLVGGELLSEVKAVADRLRTVNGELKNVLEDLANFERETEASFPAREDELQSRLDQFHSRLHSSLADSFTALVGGRLIESINAAWERLRSTNQEIIQQRSKELRDSTLQDFTAALRQAVMETAGREKNRFAESVPTFLPPDMLAAVEQELDELLGQYLEVLQK